MSSVTNAILGLHGLAALALIFALPALESSVFVGFVFPGETAAVLGGVLASEHRINLAAAVVAVVLGAIIGDTVGYAVGRTWGTRLVEGPLSRWIKGEHLARTRVVIARRGAWAVFVGRWTAALRVLVPGIAGIARMPYPHFAAANVAGGAAWGTTFVLIGYAAGQSWHAVAHTAGTVGLAAVGGAAVLVVAAVLVRRRLARRHTR